MVKATLTGIISFSFLCGCINVAIGNSNVKKADGIRYSEPPKPFAKESREDVDAFWRNSKNGNSIAFLSDCGDASDPDLDTIASGIFNGIKNLEYKSNQNLTYRNREAKRVLAQGQVDGVPTLTDLLVFKKNRCIYVLSYVSVATSHDANTSDFEHFIQGFNPP